MEKKKTLLQRLRDELDKRRKFKWDGELDEKGRRLTADGMEIPDATVVAPPIGYKAQPSMVEHIRNMVRSEMLARAAEEMGKETFEEADDFDVDEDDDPNSPWENEFDPPVRDIMAAGREAIAARRKAAEAQKEPPKAAPPQPAKD